MGNELQLAKSRAVQLFRSGDLTVAEKLCHEILQANGDDADTWCLLSSVCRQQQKGIEALTHARKAIGLLPEHAQPRLLAGLAFLTLQQPENAIIAFGHAIKFQPNHREALIRKAEAHIATRQLAEAKECFLKVLELAPAEANSLCTMAELMRKTGEAEKAIENIKTILKANPQTAVAHLVGGRAEFELEKYDDAEKRLTGLLSRHSPSPIKAASAKLLGDVFEAKGDFVQAFEKYQLAQETSESHNRTRIDEAKALDDIEHRSKLLEELDPTGWEDFDDGLESPVFLVGLPRTGVTLVEHLLCPHSRVVTSNQRDYVSRTVLSIGNYAQCKKEYPENLAELDDDAIRRLRESYWKRVEQYVPDRGDRILLDRSPMAIMDLTFIRRLFPASPIVHVVRDPRDACLSCFTEVLDFSDLAVLFSQLERSARVYGKLAEFASNAIDKLKPNVLEVRYENLVAGFDEAKKVVQHMGLNWETAQEDFVPVAWEKYILDLCGETARQLTSRSVGRWKKYESQLENFLPLLAEQVAGHGYS